MAVVYTADTLIDNWVIRNMTEERKEKKNYVVHVVRKGLCSEVRCFRSY